MSMFASVAREVGLRFSPLTDEDILNKSYVEVKNTEQISTENNRPYRSGIYDDHMGAQSDYPCLRCRYQSDKCVGHCGHTELEYPLLNLLTFDLRATWLNVICIRCHRLIFDFSIKSLYPGYDDIPDDSRVTELIAYFKQLLAKRYKPIFCDHCNNIKQQVEDGIDKLKKFEIKYIQPQYDNNDSIILIDVRTKPPEDKNKKYTKPEGAGIESVLIPSEQLSIFESLKDEELLKIGLTTRCHPRHFINRRLLIPPVTIRYINNYSKLGLNKNQITSNLNTIISSELELRKKSMNKFDPGFLGKPNNNIVTLEDLESHQLKHSKYCGVIKTDSKTSIYDKMKGKTGTIRMDNVGMVVAYNISRSVIACDPNIPLDCIGVPLDHAKTFLIPEKVTIYNKDRLMKYVINGNNYPGCVKIGTGKITRLNNGTPINVGDVVYRHVVDGDVCLANRPPTFFTTSTTMLYVKVVNSLSIMMNPCICAAFNADFDGDQMTVKIVNSIDAQVEASKLCTLDRHFMKSETAEPISGQIQESILGLALLTNSKVNLSKFDTMRLFSNIPIDIKFDKKSYTGREIFSMVMPAIDYEAPSHMLKEPFMKEFGDFDESDYTVVIKKGKLLSGIVCGNAVKAKFGSIYHTIANNISSKKAMEVIYHHQQIALKYIEIHGATISPADVRLSDDSKKLIDLVKSKQGRELDELYNQLLEKQVVPPSGMKMSEYVQKKIIDILSSNSKSYISAVIKSIDPSNNWLFLMVMSGAKGSIDNIIMILCCIGLMRINSRLIKPSLGDYRFGIHSRQFSDDPQDLGYVYSSTVEGFKPRDLLAIAQSDRRNILTKGLVVSTAGYASKILIRVSESAVVDYRGFTVRGNGSRIIEMNNVDCGFRPNKSQNNKIKLLTMSDADISKEYTPDRLRRMKGFRDELIEYTSALQNNNVGYEISNSFKLPIDIAQIISSTLPDQKSKDTVANFKMFDEFVDDLHYLRFNRIHQVKKTQFPECISKAYTLLRIALSSAFSEEVIKMYNSTQFAQLLNLISFRIKDAMFQAGDPIGLSMAQAFGAPLTQYLIDAHHVAASGGTSRDGLEYVDTILKHRGVKECKINNMYIYLKGNESKEMAEKLANFITAKKFKSVLEISEILYEPFGTWVTHDDGEYARKYIKNNNRNINPEHLHNIHFRFTLSRDLMIAKKVELDEMVNRIIGIYTDRIIPIIVDDPKSSNVILLLYFRLGFNWIYLDRIQSDAKKKKLPEEPWKEVYEFKEKFINETTVNSFRGIESAEVHAYERYVVNKGVPEKIKNYYVKTNGINMLDVLLIDVVDKTRTRCNNVMETFRFRGLIPAKQVVVSELYNNIAQDLSLLPGVYTLLANLMMETGEPTAISDSGQKFREKGDVLLRMSYKNPLVSIKEGTVNDMILEQGSFTSDIIKGQTPSHIGTGKVNIILNEEFVNANRQATEEDLV